MTGLAAYAVHEAEMEIARATAVRALMQTGATHDEAVAAVDHHLHDRGAHLMTAIAEDTFTAPYELVRAVFRRSGPRIRFIAEILTRRGPDTTVVGDRARPLSCPLCDMPVSRAARRRIGPRTVVRCDICAVRWKARVRHQRAPMRLSHEDCTRMWRPWNGKPERGRR